MNLPFKKFNAFTLVELLIVIVIIGILMSALLPRLQGAQDLARDTSRTVALGQLQTAIMSYRSLKGNWPADKGTGTSSLKTLVDKGFLTELPVDPIELSYTGKANDDTVNISKNRDFMYFVVKKNKQPKGAIVLATRVETDSRANYVSSGSNDLKLPDDFKDIYPCSSVEVKDGGNKLPSTTGNVDCETDESSKLRYILKFS